MHTILIIEDEEPLRQTLADRLTMEGFRVQTAADGYEGVRQAEAEPPDLILCDIMMPGMDGYTVLQTLQAEERTASIPFIFLTAKANPQQVRAGMELGADDYLCKPVSKGVLLAAIRSRLERRRQQQQRLDQNLAAVRLEVVRRLPHELLTPLTGLLAAGQLLEAEDPTKPFAGIRDIGRVIRLASERLHRTIRRFLSYAELMAASQDEKAQEQLRGTEYFSAMSFTADLTKRLAQRDSRLDDLQLDLREVEVVLSSAHFADLVTELVDNAFKFSVSGEVVRVHLNILPEEGCLLEVVDHGRGMTLGQLSQVAAFRQFDSERWAQAGTGLGLALVQQIAALYGGRFAIESDPAKGTRVAVRLPRARLVTNGVNKIDSKPG